MQKGYLVRILKHKYSVTSRKLDLLSFKMSRGQLVDIEQFKAAIEKRAGKNPGGARDHSDGSSCEDSEDTLAGYSSTKLLRQRRLLLKEDSDEDRDMIRGRGNPSKIQLLASAVATNTR